MSEDKKFQELKDTPIDRFVMDLGAKDNKSSDEIFSPGKDPDDIELRTDLTPKQIVLIQGIIENDNILEKCGIGKMYDNFIRKFMRLRVSKDRESRKEYSTANRPDNSLETIQTAGNLAQLGGKDER